MNLVYNILGGLGGRLKYSSKMSGRPKIFNAHKKIFFAHFSEQKLIECSILYFIVKIG